MFTTTIPEKQYKTYYFGKLAIHPFVQGDKIYCRYDHQPTMLVFLRKDTRNAHKLAPIIRAICLHGGETNPSLDCCEKVAKMIHSL